MYALYSAALGVVLLAWLPGLVLRRLRSGYGRDLCQRFGRLEPGLPREPRCWIHAVSVGEATAAVALVEGIRRRWPDLSVVVSTATPTGARIVADRLRGRAVHRYFPIDLPGPVRRAVDAVRPRFFIAVETELWPNFLRALARRGIPAMIANGRISDRSFRGYRRVRWLMKRVLGTIAVFAMQSQEDAQRIIALGAPSERVLVTGNLKTDLAPETGRDADTLWRQALGLTGRERVLVAGSTHRGEEAMILDVFERLRTRVPELVLLLAPRHPERAGEVEQLVRARGLDAVRRSWLPHEPRPGVVIILDTVGELAELYHVGEVVFIGGSLVPAGGHNMLEPALRRKPVLFGPYTTNFRESAELLLGSGGALVVKDADELEREGSRLLDDRELGRRMGEAAFVAVTERQGAVAETLALIERFLHPASGTRS